MSTNCAGNLFWAGFPGKTIPAALAARLESGDLGGIILFSRNFGSEDELAALTTELHGRWRGEGSLLLGVDQEGGRVARIKTIRWPSAGQLAAFDDEVFTGQIARRMSQELAHFGFNTDFAPVLDVFTNPRNTVIGDRAYGTEPERVIRHARAFIRALATGGMLTCGKHFPGHGDTLADSHETLPTCSLRADEFENVHERPFRELAGLVDFIMTAHVLAPAVDPDRPATLSPVWIQRARSLPFSGLLVSDDLEMGAMKAYLGELATGIFRAGLDMGMVCASPDFLEECIGRVNAEGGQDAGFAAGIAARVGRVNQLRLRVAQTVRTPAPQPRPMWIDSVNKLIEKLTVSPEQD
ncbi:beta-N-acetylhexosaminidase [Myxococcota bacterium]|nr:beta-N-acetylhexosaminidase [Myxococcota bacterium]